MVDKSITLYPGLLSLISGSTSLSDEMGKVWYLIVLIPDLCLLTNFKQWSHLWDVLNKNHCQPGLPVEPMGAPGYKPHKTINTLGSVLVTAKKQPENDTTRPFSISAVASIPFMIRE